MVKVLPLADEPKKAYYLEDWDKAKGYTQPLPFAQGKSITLGVDDALARINVKSDTADLMLFDGRDRAQNGWFVLRSLIPSGKTDRRHRVAHPAGRDSELDAAANDRAQPGRLCAGILQGGGARTRPEVQRPEDGQSAAPDGGRIVQAGLRGPDHAFNALAAVCVFEIRLHAGEGPRPLRH